MRLHPLLASFAPAAVLLLSAANAHAQQAQPQQMDGDDATFGTTPARSKAQMQLPKQPLPMAPQQAPSAGAGAAAASPSTTDDAVLAGDYAQEPRTIGSYDSDVRRSSNAPIATDPPGDWAVLHAGLRPRLGTFGGIATVALAHARPEQF